ncbi:MAG: conjugal transfer protein TraX [Beijerinckiaceae bacterium]|nr:conjugal transfer protein TraX [Beijerinckiaceae bacterium]
MRSPATVTTTDLLKLAGLVFVFADHFGLFFAPDEDWWRVAGRAAAPIFFFLIGFARTRTIPMSWLVLGAILTALDIYVSEGLDDVTLNILFNFALVRLAVAWIDARVLTTPWGERWGLLPIALLCAAAIPLAGFILEYGAEGWLWALFGVAAREAISRGSPQMRLQRNMIALFCAAVYIVVETHDYDFEPEQTAVLALLMGGLALTLVAFRRTDVPFAAPAPLVRALNWIGRHSLEIYAVSLFLMQLGAHLLDDGSAAGDDGD